MVRLLVLVATVAMVAMVACAGPVTPSPLPSRSADARVVSAARVRWHLDCPGREGCSCREAGASDVRVIARGRGSTYDDRFECIQSLAVTGPLAAGPYDVELELETDEGVRLGSAATAADIGDGGGDGDGGDDATGSGAITDLGELEIRVGS